MKYNNEYTTFDSTYYFDYTTFDSTFCISISTEPVHNRLFYEKLSIHLIKRATV